MSVLKTDMITLPVQMDMKTGSGLVLVLLRHFTRKSLHRVYVDFRINHF